MGFLGLREDAHLQLKRRRVKNMEGPQRQQVLRGGRRQGIANESQVIVLEEGLWGGLWRGSSCWRRYQKSFWWTKEWRGAIGGVQRRGVIEERMGGRGWGK
ncbi:hypothetical protein ACFX1Q_041016 [Malus domestica]